MDDVLLQRLAAMVQIVQFIASLFLEEKKPGMECPLKETKSHHHAPVNRDDDLESEH